MKVTTTDAATETSESQKLLLWGKRRRSQDDLVLPSSSSFSQEHRSWNVLEQQVLPSRVEALVRPSVAVTPSNCPKRMKMTNNPNNKESLLLVDRSSIEETRQASSNEERPEQQQQDCFHGLRKKARCSSSSSSAIALTNKKEEETANDDQIISAPSSFPPSVVTEVPDPLTSDMDPDSYLLCLIKAQSGKTLHVKAALDLHNYFPEISEAQVSAYNNQIVTACRNNQVDVMKDLWQHHGQSLECCNRFGESLLHMACRRGFEQLVQFLLQFDNGVGLAVRIRDDCGRTPLHDACWHAQPQIFICEMLLERDPELLLIADKRGHTPFQYAREQDWPLWRQMLYKHRVQLFQRLTTEHAMQHFSS